MISDNLMLDLNQHILRFLLLIDILFVDHQSESTAGLTQIFIKYLKLFYALRLSLAS